MVGSNLELVKERIRSAAKRAGRDPECVKLIAVSKTKPISMIEECIRCGQTVFGENRVQELMEKMPALPADLEWHLIGTLQKNKVKYVVGKVCLIHSVDSVKLAEQISREAVKRGCIADILLEVNVAREESKSGFYAEDVSEACEKISALSGICIRGLMTVAPRVDDPEKNRPVFRKLHEIFIDIRDKKADNICMTELSMGMTNDFEVAVEEGATMVRVGTAIFGERDYSYLNQINN